MPKLEKTRKLQDKSKQEVVLNALKLGCSLTAAAKLVNCSPTTIHHQFIDWSDSHRVDKQFDIIEALDRQCDGERGIRLLPVAVGSGGSSRAGGSQRAARRGKELVCRREQT